MAVVHIVEPTFFNITIAICTLTAEILFLHLTSHLYRQNAQSLAYRAEKDAIFAELEQAKAVSDEARRRAEAANMAKSQFLATMSHELRTPLNAILGFSELMRGEMLGPIGNPAYKTYLDDIHSSGQHLLRIINDILDLSRIEAGKRELREELTSLSEIAREACSLLDLKARQKDITVNEIFEENLPKIIVDEQAMRQVVLNLVSNALKFTPKGGEVDVKVGRTQAGGQYVSVRDNGPGIPEDEIPVVLSAFGQGVDLAQDRRTGHRPRRADRAGADPSARRQFHAAQPASASAPRRSPRCRRSASSPPSSATAAPAPAAAPAAASPRRRCRRAELVPSPPRPPRSNVAMPLWAATAALTMPAASAAPVPSPSRMPRSRSGVLPSCSSTARMRRLRRAVREEAMVDRARVDRMQDRRGGGRDEAVDDDRHALHPRREDRADHGRDLAPAEPAQHLQRIALARRAARTAAPTASALRFSPASSTPVPRPTQSAGLAAIERVEDRRRDGRVGDPHLAEAEQVDAAGHRLHAVGDRRRAGFFVERVLDDDVRRRLVERELEDLQPEVVGLAELVDRRAAGGEIRHHLPRDRLRDRPRRRARRCRDWRRRPRRAGASSPACARPCQAATHAAISSSRPRLPAGLVSTASRARDRRRGSLVRAGQIVDEPPDVVEGQAGRGALHRRSAREIAAVEGSRGRSAGL